jgi:hypothetical protein
VILLCLCVVGGVWWAGTRKHDFLTPPSESQLPAIRTKNADVIPPPDDAPDLGAAPQTAEAMKPVRVFPAPKSNDESPQLAEYRNQAASDPALLAETARQLETQEKLQRALLAWERILDTATPDETRAAEALLSIKRLRSALPDWNTDPAKTIAITLHAGAGKSTAEILTPVLEEIARDLEKASSGILKITPNVASGREVPKSRGASPIAIWFSGPGTEARSTEVFAFTSGSPEMLRDDLLKTVLRLVRSYLARTASLTVTEAGDAGEAPFDAIQLRITRFGWHELGSRLNKTLE